jgi:iron complex transport system substrate-binding protein
MKSIKGKIFHYLIYGLLLHTAGCRPGSEKPEKPASAISVTDFRGKEVVLEKPATRIVCLIESALSGLYMLGAEEQVVGVSSSIYKESIAPYYAALDIRIRDKKIPSPGNWDFVSLEGVMALQPDLVIIWSSQEESIEAMEERGIPVYSVFLTCFADVHKEITDLGKLTGKQTRADSLIDYTQKEVMKLKAPLKKKEPDAGSKTAAQQSVYYMWAQGMLETAGKTSTVNEMIELAGAKNCCPVEQEHVVINMENLLQWNPDVILLSFNTKTDPGEIIRMPEWQGIAAVKNNRIYKSPGLFYADLWTLKYPFAVKALAKYCYPVIHKEMDLETERITMLRKLYGIRGETLIKLGL